MIKNNNIGKLGAVTANLSVIKPVFVFIPLLVFASWIFFEALFLDKAIIHGDSIVHGLPVLALHADVLDGTASALWSDKVFGGHPVFAESQFAFLSPLNVLVASVLPPIFAKAVYHWLCLLLTGAGMIALCRRLSLGFSATVFASCTVAFSGLWIGSQQNLTISGALMWVPWSLWAMERWLQDPRQYLALIITMTLAIFAGYPQIQHGVVIYMMVSMVSLLLSPAERNKLQSNLRAYIGYGILAVCICIGLSAVQTLPLLELVGYSHRSAEVQLLNIPAANLFRGMLFSPIIDSLGPPHFWLLGSVLVCVLASAIIFIRPGERIVGHCVATFILFNLGLGKESLLFSFVFEHKLIPGLQYFRLSWPYFAPVVVGVALMAAAVIDGLPQVDFRQRKVQAGSLVLAVAWGFGLYQLHVQSMPLLHYVMLALALIATVLAIVFSRRRWMGPLLLGVVLLEIALLKMNSFVFYDSALLDQPATVTYLKEKGDIQNYKVHDVSPIAGYSFLPSRHPKLVNFMQGMMAAVSPSSNLLWGISAFGGAHALPQHRRMLIESVVKEEIEGSSDGRAGLRMIDILAIRYITASFFPPAAGMKQLYWDGAHKVSIIENTAAFPRFQTYSNYQFVEDVEEALAVLQSVDSRYLVLEKQGDESPVEKLASNSIATDGAADINFSVIKASATEYQLEVDARDEAWLFIADANYPGWKAYLDGGEVKLYSAQVLGKAVQVPPGQHKLRLVFKPTSVIVGACVSIAALVILLLLLATRRWKTRSARTVHAQSAG